MLEFHEMFVKSSLQEIIFFNHIENILSSKNLHSQSEYALKNAYLKLYTHLYSWHNREICEDQIRNYRRIYTQLFNVFYKKIKEIRNYFIEIAPKIGKIKFNLIPSVKKLIGYYNHKNLLQMTIHKKYSRDRIER